MRPYDNLDGDSGIVAYEIKPRAIAVRFMTGGDYEYTYESAGREAVEAMKRLAQAGRGLATYINQKNRDMLANGQRISRAVDSPARS